MIDLFIDYENNPDIFEFISELESFKDHVYILDECLKNSNYFETLYFIYKNNLLFTIRVVQNTY